jgi:predicted HTH transcriptional regulator
VNPQRPSSYLEGLVRELSKLRRETEWVEFKVDNDDPQTIGEYVSALANAAALAGKARGYLLWGVRDDDHAIVGTAFEPRAARKGNEELESWLLRLMAPRIDFVFHEVEVDGKHVVLLEIDRASRQPVAFRGAEYIRVGTSKKKLKDFPEKERALWRIFDHDLFEEGIAAEQLSAGEVLLRLDYPAYFDLVQVPLPDGRTAILDALQRERLVKP